MRGAEGPEQTRDKPTAWEGAVNLGQRGAGGPRDGVRAGGWYTKARGPLRPRGGLRASSRGAV